MARLLPTSHPFLFSIYPGPLAQTISLHFNNKKGEAFRLRDRLSALDWHISQPALTGGWRVTALAQAPLAVSRSMTPV